MSDLPTHHEEHPDVISHNARVGLVLFVLYFLLYLGFLFLNVLSPKTMALTACPSPLITNFPSAAPTSRSSAVWA